MKVLVTGANGFLGSRASGLLAENGHEVVRVSRPRGAERAGAKNAVRIDAGDPAARELIAGCDAVLHFAGIPDPARAREDPARAVRENAGTTLNLLEGCLEHAPASSIPPPCEPRSTHRPIPTLTRSASAKRLAACMRPRRSSSIDLGVRARPGRLGRRDRRDRVVRARALAASRSLLPVIPSAAATSSMSTTRSRRSKRWSPWDAGTRPS